MRLEHLAKISRQGCRLSRNASKGIPLVVILALSSILRRGCTQPFPVFKSRINLGAVVVVPSLSTKGRDVEFLTCSAFGARLIQMSSGIAVPEMKISVSTKTI